MNKRTHILVVDDDLISSLILEQTIAAGLDQIEISKAVNGQEALNVLKSKHIDLILLDINMPIMNGFELLEAMKQNKFNTPTFMITSSDLSEDRDRSLAYSNVLDFFQKPFTLIHVDHVREWIEKSTS